MGRFKSFFTKTGQPTEKTTYCPNCSPSQRGCPLAGFPLSLASEGEKVRIIMIRKGKMLHERLGSMGLKVDDAITVIKKQPGGGTIIEKSGNRYALGGGMSLKINVMRCEGNGTDAC